jgi:hypothetical protein
MCAQGTSSGHLHYRAFVPSIRPAFRVRRTEAGGALGCQMLDATATSEMHFWSYWLGVRS